MNEQNQPIFGGQGGMGPDNAGSVGGFDSFGMPVAMGNVPQPGYGVAGGGVMEQNYTGNNEDVVIATGGGPKKGGKKVFAIVGILLLLVAIVCGIIAIAFGGGGGGLLGGGKLEGFAELKEFIEKGDAETRELFEGASDEEEDSEGYIMAIRISEKDEADVRKYYDKLGKLEQAFYSKAVDRVDESVLAEYENALMVLRNAINYREVESGLIKAYEEGGESGAKSYFEDKIECNGESGELANVCETEKNYYTAVLTEHKVYAEAGCYKGAFYDSRCSMDYYGVLEFESYISEADSQKRSFSLIDYGSIYSVVTDINQRIMGNSR